MSITEEGLRRAVAVLESAAKPTGFYASGLPHGYEATWARDSMITSLGASLLGEKFEAPFRKSLALLAKNQSELGQIPNAVGTYNRDRQSDVTYNTVDSTLWYILGHFAYARAYNDKSLFKAHIKNINKALLWLKYQDPNEDKLLVQQPTMDWQDAFPHKYGRAINTQALYYAVLLKIGDVKLAGHIKRVVNGEIEKYLSLYDSKLGYYLPWAWKNHDGLREEEYWFDTLGNLLAIVSGLATPRIAEKILHYIDREKINRPYPCKAIYPPIKPGDKEWHPYFSESDARTPYQYLNAGIWPMIGGFYVAALVAAGQFKKAQSELKRLAEANKKGIEREWEFNEWLHGRSGRPYGTPYQAWSAGAYIFAYESARQRGAPFF